METKNAIEPDKNKSAPSAIGLALMVGGALILSWVLYDNFKTKPAAYKRVLIEEGKTDKFPDLGLAKNDDINIRKYEIRTPGIDKPLAEFHMAQTGNAPPVPLSWQSKLAEPVLFMDSEPKADKKIAEIMEKHIPKDALVLGWWDTSRRLKFYKNLPVVFGNSAPASVFVPNIWRYQTESITHSEQTFWRGAGTIKQQNGDFTAFQKALLLDSHSGIEALAKIANTKKKGKEKRVFLALNLLDTYKIGNAMPDQFGIGFKDFPRNKQSHGLIKGVKSWVKDHGYTSYSVYPLDENVIRIFFLTDETSKHTLLASLLPFDSSKPGQTPGAKLVYQHRGYWIYELNPTVKSAQKPSP